MSHLTSFLRKSAGRALTLHPAEARLVARIAIDDRLIPYLFADPRLPLRLSAEHSLRRDFLGLVGDDRLLGAILDDPLLSERLYLSEPARRQLQSNPRVQRFLLTDAKVIEAIAGFEEIARKLAQIPRWRQWLLEEESFRQWAAGNEELFDLIAQGGGAAERIVRDGRLLDALMRQPAVFGRFVADDGLVGRLFGEKRVIERWTSEPGWPELARAELLGRLAEDPAALDAFMQDGRFAERFYNSQGIQGRIRADKQLFLELARADAGLAAIVGDKRLLGKILTDAGLEEIAGNERLLETLLGDARVFERLLNKDDLLARLLWHERVQERIFASETLLFKILSSEQAWARIVGDDQFLLRLASHERVLGKILADEQLLTKLVASERAFGKILADEQLLTKLVSSERAFGKILADEQLLTRLVSSERAFGKILADEQLFTKLVTDKRAIEKITESPQLLAAVTANERAAKNMLADEAIAARILAQPKLVELLRQRTGLLGRIVLNGSAVRGLLAEPAIVANKSIDGIMEAHAEFRRVWRAIEPYVDTTRPGLAERLHESMKAIAKPEDVAERLLAAICDEKKVYLNGAALAYTDRFSLWTELNEILVDEDYYFETDAAEPRILDCGTNFGLALYYFKRLYPKAHVTGFEPVPALHRIARANARDNKMSGVKIEKCAIAAEAGKSVFYESMSYPMAGSLTTRRQGFGDTLNEIQVECKPLSRFIDGPIDFLKLDIEGSEDAVLTEAAEKLPLVRNLFVEYHHGSGSLDGRLETILRILDGAGFEWQLGKAFHFGRQSRRRALTCCGQPFSLNIWARQK